MLQTILSLNNRNSTLYRVVGGETPIAREEKLIITNNTVKFMKKYLFPALALGLVMTSCQSDEPFAPGMGEEVQATFTISVPEAMGTRAAGHSSAEGGYSNGAGTLNYTVVLLNDANKVMYSKTSPGNGTSATFNPIVVSNYKYKILAYATFGNEAVVAPEEGQTIADTDAINNIVTLKGINDESEDAYFCNDTITGAPNMAATLKRPFGKLRLVATDYNKLQDLGLDVKSVKVTYGENVVMEQKFDTFNKAFEVEGGAKEWSADKATYAEAATNELTVFVDYLPAADGENDETMYPFEIEVTYNDNKTVYTRTFAQDIPVKRNYLTTLRGDFFTTEAALTLTVDEMFDGGFENEQTFINVDSAEDFSAAFVNPEVDVIVLEGDINLNDILTRAANDPKCTINSGKTLTIDLNGKRLSATSAVATSNREMFLVKGNLTVKNGTIEYKHEGENMGWNYMSTIFDVTAGGVLNLNGVTAKNLGGTDMAFVAHLNNWGEVTLNAENCTLESTYVPVRVFNSGYDMNNVTIKNSTLTGGNYAFWVHNYTVEDFGTQAKADAQKALLNLNIYNQGNKFTPDMDGVRYGFTNSVKTDAYGITKAVSEDGTVVTLGSVIENGLVRRGVAGAEENTTIKKAVVGEGITTLYDRTFRRFYALETVELPSTLTTIGAAGSGVFQSCKALKKIVLPESVTVLGKGSFQECSSLESINIPAGVTRIESDCLRATGLKEVEFHAGVTYFGAQAFRDCKQLTKVVINAPEFTMESNTFGIMATPFTPMTIEVANAAMKAYVESKLTAHAKTYITVVPKTTISEKITDKNGETYTGDAFESGSMNNALWFNNYYFNGDAAIVVENKTYNAIIVENCCGNFKNDVITIKNNNSSVIILQNLDFTLAEGKKLLKSVNPYYQVFMSNIRVNGQKVTQETIGKYLENVAWYQVVDNI